MKDVKTEKEIKSPIVTDMLPPSSGHIESQPESQNHEFKLAPTPAQLGKAPLQRRQSMGKSSPYSYSLNKNLSFQLFLGQITHK